MDETGAEQPASIARKVLRLPAEQAWELLTDMRHHPRWIPLTRMDAPARLPVGARFTATSGPFARRGAPGLADTMEVVRSDPPGTPAASGADEGAGAGAGSRERAGAGAGAAGGPGTTGVAVYRKLGPVLLGTAEVHVRPLGPDLCETTWVERVHLRGLPPGLTAPLLRPVLQAMTAFALRRVAAEVHGD